MWASVLQGTKWLPCFSVYLYAVPGLAVRDNTKDTVLVVLAGTTVFFHQFIYLRSQIFIWQRQYGIGQNGIFIKQLAEPKAAYFFEHLLCCLCVLSHAQLLHCGFKCRFRGINLNGRDCVLLYLVKLSQLSPYVNHRLFVIASLCQERRCTCQII